MKQQLAITNSQGLVLDASPFVLDASFATNEHGTEHISLSVERSPTDDLHLFAREALFDVGLHEGPITHARARIESPGLAIGQDNSYSVKALGYWRAFSDIPYSARGNMSDYGQFREMTSVEAPTRTPEKYKTDTNGRIYMAPIKNTSYSGNTNNVSINYTVPSGSRPLVGVQADYRFNFPANWVGRCIVHDPWFNNGSTILTLTGSGSLQSGSFWGSFSGRQAIYFDLYLSGSTATFGGETGSAFFEITNLRLVTSLTNAISTTLTANATAGSNVTLSVTSTAGMYVGQELLIGATTSAMERVHITAINSATSITVATLVANKASTNLVRAHKITPDQIVRDCVTSVSAANPSQLSSSLSLLQSGVRDLSDTIVFEDADMSEILNDLAQKGDGTRPFEVGVTNDKVCYFRPKYSAAKTWFVYVDELRLERTLDGLYNSAYGVYKGSRNENQRTATSSDSTSVARYGLTRRQAVKADTTSSVVATSERDHAIANTKSVVPRAQFPIERIFSQAGIPANVSEIKAGDILILHNLPVTGELNAIAQLHLSRTEVDLVNGVLTVEPELPLPTVDVQLAH